MTATSPTKETFTFDDFGKIRILPLKAFEDSESLKEETKEFVHGRLSSFFYKLNILIIKKTRQTVKNFIII